MSTRQFKCTIKKMFKGCPKPDGWFGCFAHIRGEEDDIRLTGKSPLALSDGLQLNVVAEQKSDDEYIAIDIQIITKTTKGLTAFLSKTPSIGQTTATRIVASVGLDALDIIKKGHDATKQMSDQYHLNLTDKQISNLVAHVTKLEYETVILTFLPELANSPKVIEQIKNEIKGPDIIAEIKKDPYILLNCPDMKFPVADTIALRLGVNPLSIRRLGAALYYLMKKDASGNLFINLSNDDELLALQSEMQHLLNIEFSGMGDFGNYLIKIMQDPDSKVLREYYGQEQHLYLREIYAAMRTIVNYVLLANKQSSPTILAPQFTAYITDYESSRTIPIQFNDEQKQAIRNTITHRMSIITGGPGRGKTTIIDCIACYWKTILKKEVLLLAPTGKATKKLRNDTKSMYETMTIDRFLYSQVYAMRKKEQSISENPYNTPNTLVIIDESSMLSLTKTADLLHALSRCRICLVGDADQLPPIDKGFVFKNIIAAQSALPNVPVSVLTETHRFDGVILDNATKINQKDTNLTYNFTDFPFFPQNNDDEDALTAILETYNDEKANNPDPDAVALLCPMRKGIIGTDNINMTLQDILCPENANGKPTRDKRRARDNYIERGTPIPGTIFGNSSKYTKLRVGDFVINTENNYTIDGVLYENDDYFNGKPLRREPGFFNGDCGRIIAYVPPEPNASKEDKASHSFLILEMLEDEYVEYTDSINHIIKRNSYGQPVTKKYKKIIELDITAGDAKPIHLGYALTVHKSQGCGYDTVIYVSPKRLLTLPKENGFASKNLVYTAVTRARNKVVILGSKDALNLCITSEIPEINSNLKERLMGLAPLQPIP